MLNKKGTTVLESVYWHIGNSGLTFEIKEELSISKLRDLPENYQELVKGKTRSEVDTIRGSFPVLPGSETWNRYWRFHVQLTAFGSKIEHSFPLVPAMVQWMQEALGRVLTRMLTPLDKPTLGYEYAFDELNEGSVRYRDGVEQVDDKWIAPIQVPTKSSVELELKTVTP